MWRYHVYGKDNKVEKVSEYVYESEQGALADASAYVKGNQRPNETWHAAASKKQ